jgi:hypothetical protein
MERKYSEAAGYLQRGACGSYWPIVNNFTYPYGTEKGIQAEARAYRIFLSPKDREELLAYHRELSQKLPRECPPRTAATGAGAAIVSASRTTVTVSGGGSRASVPQVQGGTQFDPVQNREVPITLSDGRLTGGSANFAVTGPTQNVLWGDYFYVSGGGSWFDGNATGQVPAGATGVAQTYIVPNPVSGSTGILAGATGQTTQIDSDGRVIDISVGLRKEGLPFFGGPAPFFQGYDRQINLQHSVGFRYRNFHLSHTIRQQSDVFPDLSSQIDLRQDSNFFGADFGLGVSIAPPGAQPGIFAGIQGFIAPGVLSTSAEATQVSHCGPCGVASPEFDLSLQRDLSSNSFAVIAGGSAQIGYRFGPGSELSLFGTVEHMTGLPFFNVPTTPNQQPINLDGRDSMTNVTVGARFTAIFANWHN